MRKMKIGPKKVIAKLQIFIIYLIFSNLVRKTQISDHLRSYFTHGPVQKMGYLSGPEASESKPRCGFGRRGSTVIRPT